MYYNGMNYDVYYMIILLLGLMLLLVAGCNCMLQF
jgi:hypothetical protein